MFLEGKKRKYLSIVLTLVVFVALMVRAYNNGFDVNVYLHASQQLFNGENIYADNPFNNYLYSPLFALILGTISFLDFSIARIIWAALNFVLAIRLWRIGLQLVKDGLPLSKRDTSIWSWSTLIISIGLLLHNFGLGQMTIVILWLFLEGIFQIIQRNNTITGSMLLALGINIKIIPIIGLYYLFFKGKYRAVFISTGMVIVSLLLPAIVIGFDYNNELLANWANTINPSNNKYVFENSSFTHSFNAALPAYFLDFNDGKEMVLDWPRRIASVSYDTLVVVMQAVRIMLALSILLLVFYKYKRRENEALYFFWEIAFVSLISALIFPHQQRYAMLYFVPAGSYLVLFILMLFKHRWKVKIQYQLVAATTILLLVIYALSGRDSIGDYMMTVINYYHAPCLTNIIFVGFLLFIRPDVLLELNSRESNSG